MTKLSTHLLDVPVLSGNVSCIVLFSLSHWWKCVDACMLTCIQCNNCWHHLVPLPSQASLRTLPPYMKAVHGLRKKPSYFPIDVMAASVLHPWSMSSARDILRVRIDRVTTCTNLPPFQLPIDYREGANFYVVYNFMKLAFFCCCCCYNPVHPAPMFYPKVCSPSCIWTFSMLSEFRCDLVEAYDGRVCAHQSSWDLLIDIMGIFIQGTC
jgi:hypothetical protein